jgi:hypothetical protein
MMYGVGVATEGRHCKYVKPKKHTYLFGLWRNMLKRCYCEAVIARHPTYAGCSIAAGWHDFQIFGDWAVSQVGYGVDGFELDKDLLVRDNKMYGPDTCVFVPHHINSATIGCNSARGEYPKGVHFDKSRGNFQAYHTEFCKRVHLGRHSTVEKAFAAYKVAKEQYIKVLAGMYKDQIDERVYNALLAYEVRIND